MVISYMSGVITRHLPLWLRLARSKECGLVLLSMALMLLCSAAVGDRVGTLSGAEGKRTRTFEPDSVGRDKWRAPDKSSSSFVIIDEEHGESLKMPVAFPGSSSLWNGPTRFVNDQRREKKPSLVIHSLQYDIYIPADIPEGIRIQSRLILKNKDGLWFEALGKRLRSDGIWVYATALFPGWNTIRVNLTDSSVDMRPRNHQMRWSRYFLAQVRSVGIAVQGDKPFSGEAAIDNITTWKETDNEFSAPLKITDFAVSSPQPRRYGRMEMQLSVNRPLLNPFRQSEIAIDAEFTTPDGRLVLVPAFYYQEYRRVKGEGRFPDRYVPVGPGVFKVRFTPRQAGEYSYRLTATYVSPVSMKQESVKTELRRTVVMDGEDRGFVGISKKDPHSFEFENGDYFFPLGHSLRSPQDNRHVVAILRKYFPGQPVPPDKGLRAYEGLLPRMQESGVNCFEVWMSSWWLGLEWTGAWKEYHGLWGYNLENAWKLDRVVDLAEKHEQYIHLVIDNHGKASQKRGSKGQHDHEWEFSPYNNDRSQKKAESSSSPVDDGGFLRYAIELFRNSDAEMLYRDKYRYIAARWGWSTHIYGIEMWSELDLIGHVQGRHRYIYGADQVRSWHERMAAYLMSQDHGRHLTTTHYSGDFNVVDWGMVEKDFLRYIVCDAYHNPDKTLVDLLRQTARKCMQYKKPFQITEFGGDWNASSIEGLTGDLYTGLWWGWTSRSSGTPLYWWFELIDQKNYYTAYAALAAFVKGEDKRRGPDEPALTTDAPRSLRIGDKPITDKQLDTIMLTDRQVYYCYIYDPKAMHRLPRELAERPTHNNVSFLLPSAKRCDHTVEIWDPWTGTMTATFNAKVGENNTLVIPLPKFVCQVALKIRAKEVPQAGTPGSRAEVVSKK